MTRKRRSDTQSLIPSAAAPRDDGNALPLSHSLGGGAAVKVLGALLSRQLIADARIEGQTARDAAGDGEAAWRNRAHRRAVELYITDAGFAAIGVEPEHGSATPTSAGAVDEASHAPESKMRLSRVRTKQAVLVAMLQRPDGASVAEISEATGWLPHTVRGAMSGVLKKRLGLEVTSEKVEGRGRVYFLTA